MFSAPDETIWIGVLRLVLYLPAAKSKKDKRKIISKLRDRFKSRYNLSIAEVGHLENLQRSILVVCKIGNNAQHLRSSLQTRFQEALSILDARIDDHHISLSKFDSSPSWS